MLRELMRRSPDLEAVREAVTEAVAAMDTKRSCLYWVGRHPCAWLFFGLLLLLVGLPYVGAGMTGRIVGFVLHDIILIAGVAVLSRSRLSLTIAIAFAMPVLAFQYAAIARDEPGLFVGGWVFAILFYLLTLTYLLRYVLSPKAMSLDKLYGAAAAYLMLGITWYYCYCVVQYFLPGSFTFNGQVVPQATRFELIYFSFAALTATGFGDIAPVSAPARSLANLEAICGILFVAMLIARLVGAYPQAKDEKET